MCDIIGIYATNNISNIEDRIQKHIVFPILFLNIRKGMAIGLKEVNINLEKSNNCNNFVITK